MTDKKQLDLAQWAVEYAQRSGADQSSVFVSNRKENNVQFRDQKLEKLQQSTANSLSLQLYVQTRYSSHSTNDLKTESLKKFIAQAVAVTRYLPQDKYRSLPDPKYYPKKFDIDLKVYDPYYEKVTFSDRKRIASQIESSARSQSDKIISVTSDYSDVCFHGVRVHSNGFTGQWKQTRFSAYGETTVKDDKNGSRPNAWHWASSRFYKDMPTSQFIGKETTRRALQKIGQTKIQSGRYNMIVENRSVGRRFLSMLARPMGARALQQKSSFLDGMVGKKIASEKFTMIDNPLLEKGIGSRLFDSEGIAAKKRPMIEKGVLRHYYVDNYYGRKLGLEPTSGSQSNLVFESGSKSLEQLLKYMDKGILVTSFIGGNSNPTTGDFSFGITGQLVENGQIVKPVNQMNISGNAKELWDRLGELGNDPYIYSSARTPSMLFEEVSFSGL